MYHVRGQIEAANFGHKGQYNTRGSLAMTRTLRAASTGEHWMLHLGLGGSGDDEIETARTHHASGPPPPRSLISFWRPPIPSDCTNPARSSWTAEIGPPSRIPFHVDEVLSRITASPYPPPPWAPFAVAATVHSNTVLDPNTAIE